MTWRPLTDRTAPTTCAWYQCESQSTEFEDQPHGALFRRVFRPCSHYLYYRKFSPFVIIGAGLPDRVTFYAGRDGEVEWTTELDAAVTFEAREDALRVARDIGGVQVIEKRFAEGLTDSHLDCRLMGPPDAAADAPPPTPRHPDAAPIPLNTTISVTQRHYVTDRPAGAGGQGALQALPEDVHRSRPRRAGRPGGRHPDIHLDASRGSLT